MPGESATNTVTGPSPDAPVSGHPCSAATATCRSGPTPLSKTVASRLPDLHRARRAVDDAADDRPAEYLRRGRIERRQQAARRLGVAQQLAIHGRYAGVQPGVFRASSRLVRLPPGCPASASSRTPASNGTADAWSWTHTPAPAAISRAWPTRPNPVTSVTACGERGRSSPAAAALSVVIEAMTAALVYLGQIVELG